jgi:presenilin-like A22 family membrane protease
METGATMVRIILGILAGIAAMVAVVAAIEFAAHLFFAVPSERGPVPAAIQILVLFAYFAGALAGSLVAIRIARARWTAWAIAAVVIAGAIWSMFMVVHPLWMQVGAVAAPALGAFAAARLAGARPAAGGTAA